MKTILRLTGKLKSTSGLQSARETPLSVPGAYEFIWLVVDLTPELKNTKLQIKTNGKIIHLSPYIRSKKYLYLISKYENFSPSNTLLFHDFPRDYRFTSINFHYVKRNCQVQSNVGTYESCKRLYHTKEKKWCLSTRTDQSWTSTIT